MHFQVVYSPLGIFSCKQDGAGTDALVVIIFECHLAIVKKSKETNCMSRTKRTKKRKKKKKERKRSQLSLERQAKEYRHNLGYNGERFYKVIEKHHPKNLEGIETTVLVQHTVIIMHFLVFIVYHQVAEI